MSRNKKSRGNNSKPIPADSSMTNQKNTTLSKNNVELTSTPSKNMKQQKVQQQQSSKKENVKSASAKTVKEDEVVVDQTTKKNRSSSNKKSVTKQAEEPMIDTTPVEVESLTLKSDVGQSERSNPSFMEIAFLNDPQRMFEALIAPYTIEDFFTLYFEKQPLFARRNDPTYFNGLYSRSDFFKEIEERELNYKKHLREEKEKEKLDEEYIPSLDPSQFAKNATSEEDEEDEKKKPLLFSKDLNVVIYNGTNQIRMNPNTNFTADGAPYITRAMLKALREIRIVKQAESEKKAKKSKQSKKSKNRKTVEDDESTHLADVDALDLDLGDEESFIYEDPILEEQSSQDFDPEYAKKAYANMSRREIFDKIQEEDAAREKERSLITLREVGDLFQVGCTLQVIHPQQRSTSIWRSLYLLESYLGSLVGSNCYITPGGSQGLAPHHDDVDVFVCQLEGRKTWNLYKPHDHLAQTCSNDYPRDVIGAPYTVTLEPGDTLYLPRGTIHEAVADSNDDYSSHLTISCSQTSTWSHLLDIALQAALKSTTQVDYTLKQSLPLCAHAFMGTLHDPEVTMESLASGNSSEVNMNAPGVISSVGQDEYEKLLAEQNAKDIASRHQDEEEDDLMDEDLMEEDMMDILKDQDEDLQEDDISGYPQSQDVDHDVDITSSSNLPYAIIGDKVGFTNYNMFFKYACYNAPQLRFLKTLRQGTMEDDSQNFIEKLLKNIDLHAAMDELQRDFALNRLPPPPPLSVDCNVVDVLSSEEVRESVMHEIEHEVNHVDFAGILSARTTDTLNDAFDVISQMDLYSSIRFKSCKDLLITVEPIIEEPIAAAIGEDEEELLEDGDEDEEEFGEFDPNKISVFEEMEEDEDHMLGEEDEDLSEKFINRKVNLGKKKVFKAVDMSKYSKNSLSHDDDEDIEEDEDIIHADTSKAKKSYDEYDSSSEMFNYFNGDEDLEGLDGFGVDEDEDEDRRRNVDEVFDFQMQQLSSLPPAHLQVSIYTSSRNNRKEHMGIGTTKLQNTTSDNTDANNALLEASCLGISTESDMSMYADDEDEDGEVDDAKKQREQYNVPLNATKGKNPIAYPLATLPALRQLFSSGPKFTHIGDLQLDYEVMRRFSTSFDIMTPFDLMGARDEDDLGIEDGFQDEDEDVVFDEDMYEDGQGQSIENELYDNEYFTDNDNNVDLDNEQQQLSLLQKRRRGSMAKNSQLDNQSTFAQPGAHIMGPLCERLRIMFLHWFVADLYVKGLIEVILDGDEARIQNKFQKINAKETIQSYCTPDDEDNMMAFENEDEDMLMDEDEDMLMDEDEDEDIYDDVFDTPYHALQSQLADSNEEDIEAFFGSLTENSFIEADGRMFTVEPHEWNKSFTVLHTIHSAIVNTPNSANVDTILHLVNSEPYDSSSNHKNRMSKKNQEQKQQYISKKVVLQAIALLTEKRKEAKLPTFGKKKNVPGKATVAKSKTGKKNKSVESSEDDDDVIEVSTDAAKSSSKSGYDNEYDDISQQQNTIRVMMDSLFANLDANLQDEDEDEDEDLLGLGDDANMAALNFFNPLDFYADEDEDMEDLQEDEDIGLQNEDEDEDEDEDAHDKMSEHTRRVLQQAYEEEQRMLAQQASEEDEDMEDMEDLEGMEDLMEDEDEDGFDFDIDSDVDMENIPFFQETTKDAKNSKKDRHSTVPAKVNDKTVPKNSKKNGTKSAHIVDTTDVSTETLDALKDIDLIPLYGKNKKIADRIQATSPVKAEEFLLLQKNAPSQEEHEANQALLFQKLATIMSRSKKAAAAKSKDVSAAVADLNTTKQVPNAFKLERQSSNIQEDDDKTTTAKHKYVKTPSIPISQLPYPLNKVRRHNSQITEGDDTQEKSKYSNKRRRQ